MWIIYVILNAKLYKGIGKQMCFHPWPANDYWFKSERQADVLPFVADLMRKRCLFAPFLHHLSPKNVQINTSRAVVWSPVTCCFLQLPWMWWWGYFVRRVLCAGMAVANCYWSTSLKSTEILFVFYTQLLIHAKCRGIVLFTSREWKHSLERDHWKSIQQAAQ